MWLTLALAIFQTPHEEWLQPWGGEIHFQSYLSSTPHEEEWLQLNHRPIAI